MPHSHNPVKRNPRSYAYRGVADAPAECQLADMQNLKALRDARGLSQTALAAMVQCNQGYLSKIEAGKANPTTGLIARIAEALDVSVVQLVGSSLESQFMAAFHRASEARKRAVLTLLDDED